MDAHMHFTVHGRPASIPDIETIKKAYLRHGVLEVRDMGNRFGAGLLARKILSGEITVKSCGYALYKKGTYGAFLGKGVEGPEDIGREVETLHRAGADFIKVINSGIVSAAGNRLVTDGGFTREELRMLCGESREAGLEVACHANSDSAIRDAVAAGVSSIEHGFFVSKETLHMMAEAGVAWTPTASALLSVAAPLPQDQRRYLEEVVDAHLLSINFACAAGVTVRVGSDSGSEEVSHGGSFFQELRLFRKAGLTNEQILSAACMDIGEIEKGNYLLVKEDFIESGNMEAVYVRGELQT
ncbi:MAG: amidohydrolase family protein [Acidobacteriota bacterium]